jgi:hypothetical protein
LRIALALSWPGPLVAQDALREQIAAIAAEANGRVSVACSLPGTALNCDFNAFAHAPMQSTFKAPLALTALHLVERGKLSLDDPIRFLASDRILPSTYSPLQDEYPAAGVDIPLRRLLELAVSASDNVAADIVLRVIGGPEMVGRYIQECGIEGFHIEDNEQGLHRDAAAQYRNWFEPAGAVQFLRARQRPFSDNRRAREPAAGLDERQHAGQSAHQGPTSGRDGCDAQAWNLRHGSRRHGGHQRYRADYPCRTGAGWRSPFSSRTRRLANRRASPSSPASHGLPIISP